MSVDSRPVRDLLITAIETNHHHGVGILLQRMFGRGEELVCLRTTSQHAGHEPFGSHHHELCSRFLTRAETEHHLRAILEHYSIRRILVVPYYREEFVHATLAKHLTGAPLCTYLMDDQNIFDSSVPDVSVADLLAVSDLRFGISPEMCAAYAAKFGQPFHVLPPLVEPGPLLPNYWAPESGEGPFCAMVGNIWTARRFEQLRALCRATGLRVHWYGNGPKASWLSGSPDEWAADGIETMGFLPEEDLVAALASYPFILLPSGSLDEDDDNPAFSRLSLPSRLLFLHARTDTPVVVLGHPETAAGSFVRRLGTGVCVAFRREDLADAIRQVTDAHQRSRIRATIAARAPAFTMSHGGEWLWRSLSAGAPQPWPFQQLFAVESTTASSRPDTTTAATDARFAPAAEFAVSRRRFLETIPSLATLPAGAAIDLEISTLQAHIVTHVVQQLLPAPARVLFIGEWTPEVVQMAARAADWWKFRDVTAWRAAGFPGDPGHLIRIDGRDGGYEGFPQFDAIVSSGWLGSLPEDFHVLEGASLYFAACTKPGGWNVHSVNAVLHPSFFWSPPAHAYLRRRFNLPRNWPGLAELLHVPDPLFMSEAAFNRDWRQAVGKSAGDFGRVCSMLAAWPKE